MKNEHDFATWFKANLGAFGYEYGLVDWKGSRHLTTPDFWCLRPGSREVVKVELELHAYNFVLHQHDPAMVDQIVCAEQNAELYGWEPVVEVIEAYHENMPTTGVRCVSTLRKLMTGKPDSWGPLLAWWQPPDAKRCVVCRQPFQFFDTINRVIWPREVALHRECLKEVQERGLAYIKPWM